MLTTYTLFKFLHIVGAITWVGGVITMTVLNARLASSSDRNVLAAMARLSRFFGSRVAGWAAALTLVAGMVMVAVSGLGFPFWVTWGFLAILVSVAFGATLIRRTGAALSERIAETEASDLQVRRLQRRLAILSTINALLLLSAVWAMVFKPMI